jgi:signal transduction histidine kinase
VSAPERDLQEIRQAAQRVVHDVNNALAPILGFSELLLEDDELLQDTEKVKHYLTMMRDGATEALNRVTSLRAHYTDLPPPT